jgi:ketosteroid isomerase-like protein
MGVRMSVNKATVQDYMEGFRHGDHEKILGCLTDDIEWWIPGWARLKGKEAFDREIENEAFIGRPLIEVLRMTEEDDVVVAEGTVRTQRKDGAMLLLVFCDVFEMRGGKVRRLTSYLVEVKE